MPVLIPTTVGQPSDRGCSHRGPCIAVSQGGTVELVLHRDIYWLGRQWCVTGYGIQAIDTTLDMRFDISAARIHEVGLSDTLEGELWFDPVDFAEAVEIARRRAIDNPQSFQPQPGNEK